MAYDKNMIEKGMKAPDFALSDQNGQIRRLADFRGKKVVLYFYSKDGTSGCTRQALGYNELLDRFTEKNAVVVGISKDSAAAHSRFAEKYGLRFTLLSDPDLTAIGLYDVLREKMNYGKKVLGVLRSSFVIDEEGIVLHARCGVRADGDPSETLALL